jgi:hypothetical protein
MPSVGSYPLASQRLGRPGGAGLGEPTGLDPVGLKGEHARQQIEIIVRGPSPRARDDVFRDALKQLRRQALTPTNGPRTAEAEFKQHLLKSGRISRLPTPADPASRPVFQPITLEGEPLSETIIRKRR